MLPIWPLANAWKLVLIPVLDLKNAHVFQYTIRRLHSIIRISITLLSNFDFESLPFLRHEHKSLIIKYITKWNQFFNEFVIIFSKFYRKVDVISWFLFHLIWKNYFLYWDFDLKSWIVDFFTHFTGEITPQNNSSSQNFSA